jgi:(S)-3,5-dihydroxyphenylglycine transaminase
VENKKDNKMPNQSVMTSLRTIELKSCVADPLLNVMNFLNEIVLQYPTAVSFAPGRPLERLFDVEEHVRRIPDFVRGSARVCGSDAERAWRQLGQYNCTNGTINPSIAKQLERDEGIRAAPEDIIVTVGAQEAMAILLIGLFDPGQDILIASDPTYIGITGLARALGIKVVPVAAGDGGLDPATVESLIRAASLHGRVRALYDIPDFNNPLGSCMSYENRINLLRVCREHDVFIVEDNPYGMFNYDSERLPTLKALDPDASVLYIGTFSKTLFPGLRLGYLIADQRLKTGERSLAQELSKIKSLLTLNSSSLSQAVVGAALVAWDYSLEQTVIPKRNQLRRNRDVLLLCLEHEFSSFGNLISWNRPHGGFFVTLTLPFAFGPAELKHCAATFGVIVCPMQFFSIGSGRENQVRLSFSAVEEDEIVTGVKNFGTFVRERCGRLSVA